MLRLSHKARNSVQSGHILDLVSTDAEKLDWVRTCTRTWDQTIACFYMYISASVSLSKMFANFGETLNIIGVRSHFAHLQHGCEHQ